MQPVRFKKISRHWDAGEPSVLSDLFVRGIFIRTITTAVWSLCVHDHIQLLICRRKFQPATTNYRTLISMAYKISSMNLLLYLLRDIVQCEHELHKCPHHLACRLPADARQHHILVRSWGKACAFGFKFELRSSSDRNYIRKTLQMMNSRILTSSAGDFSGYLCGYVHACHSTSQ